MTNEARPEWIVATMATSDGVRDVSRWDEETGGYGSAGLLVDDDWIDAQIEKATADVRAERDAAIARAEAAEALAASRLDVSCPECCGPDSPTVGTTNCGTCFATGDADRERISERIRSLLDVSPRDVAGFLLAYDEAGCADVIADAGIEHVASVVQIMAALRAHAAKVSR